jgi:uncharacterized membrane protein YcaP (DUF421 family)
MDILKVILTSILSAVSLFIIAKVMGHKQMSQLDFFDYITGITIGSIAAELATELDSPLNPLIAMVVYGIITVILTTITNKLPKARKFINGTPTIIMNNGKIYKENMKKAKLDLTEFMVLLRQEGYFNLDDVGTAIFEYNGRLTVLPVSAKRPVTPYDMNLTIKPEYINTELIMDGKILHENLKRIGVDLRWLEKQIKIQGFKSEKEIFLGVCDKQYKVSFYKYE